MKGWLLAIGMGMLVLALQRCVQHSLDVHPGYDRVHENGCYNPTGPKKYCS